MQQTRIQNGAVLLLILIIILLGASAWLLTNLNQQRSALQIEDQRQTARVLAQAKEALIGFAATYAETHEGQLAGYLPCPDNDGDGSADGACSERGYSVVGRFPWKTLGLPPLRDGSGECLWYAVSGNFKDNPKAKQTAAAPLVKTLTSDDGGLLLVEDENGTVVTGVTEFDRAIAIVIAPGNALSGQNRSDLGEATKATECGNGDIVMDNIGDPNYPTLNPINRVSNYLENYSQLIFVPSATGKSGFFAAKDNNPADNTTLATFMKAPLQRDSDGNGVFNDTVTVTNPSDFTDVYKMMDLTVAKRVTNCLAKYAAGWQQYYKNVIGDVNSPTIGTYREEYQTEIENYVTLKSAECANQDCLKECIDKCNEDVPCIDECKTQQEDSYRRNALNYMPRYPWPVPVDDVEDGQYTDSSGTYFGRISDSNVVLNVSTDMFTSIGSIIDKGSKHCFIETNNFEDYEWSWWDEWKERVFYAIDDDAAPNTIYFWVKTIKQDTETIADFTLRSQTLKENTFAKIVPPGTAPTDWTSAPIPAAGAVNLRLNDNEIMKNASFLVIVAGRRLTGQARQTADDKKVLENYLEGDNTTPTDNTFERKPIKTDFNDIVCKNTSSDCKILY